MGASIRDENGSLGGVGVKDRASGRQGEAGCGRPQTPGREE